MTKPEQEEAIQSLVNTIIEKDEEIEIQDILHASEMGSRKQSETLAWCLAGAFFIALVLSMFKGVGS